jgi:hypothetical protein
MIYGLSKQKRHTEALSTSRYMHRGFLSLCLFEICGCSSFVDIITLRASRPSSDSRITNGFKSITTQSTISHKS